MKLKFAPGCFDNFDGTQEELDALIAELQKMTEDGTIFDNAKPISEEEIENLPNKETRQ